MGPPVQLVEDIAFDTAATACQAEKVSEGNANGLDEGGETVQGRRFSEELPDPLAIVVR